MQKFTSPQAAREAATNKIASGEAPTAEYAVTEIWIPAANGKRDQRFFTITWLKNGIDISAVEEEAQDAPSDDQLLMDIDPSADVTVEVAADLADVDITAAPGQLRQDVTNLLDRIQALPTKVSAPKVSANDAKAQAGVIERKVIGSATNQYAQRHADCLFELASEYNLDDLRAYKIGGTNSYTDALRRYRDQLVVAVEVRMAAAKVAA